MNDDRRNPYLVLGVPFGATRSEATAAFARRSKRARREQGFPYSVDDLTWALNQIEERRVDPSADVGTFRVPADRAVLDAPDGPGALRIEARPIERRTGAVTPAMVDALHRRTAEDLLVTALLLEAASVAAQYGIGQPTTEVRAAVVEPAAAAPRRSTAAGAAPVTPARRGGVRPAPAPQLSLGAFAARVAVVVLVVAVAAVAVVAVLGGSDSEGSQATSSPQPIATVPAGQGALPSSIVEPVVRPPTTQAPPTTRLATTTTARPSTTVVAAASMPYFDLLTSWTLSAALRMQDESVADSPAWRYARHLEQVHRVNGDGGLDVTFSETGAASGSLCIAGTCFDITDIEVRGPLVYTFAVNGVDIGPMSKAWPSGTGPYSCWYEGSDLGCPAANAVTMRLETVYTVGSTTWISVEFDVGSGVSPASRPTSASIATSGGRVTSTSFSGSADLYPGGVSVWLFKFSGITTPQISQLSVTVEWDSSMYDWTIDIN